MRSQTLERISAHANADSDWGDLHERAYDAGITYYEQAVAARQAMLNLFAVAIYHQFEQQQITLVRREMTFGGDEDNPSKRSTKAFTEILFADAEIDVHSFPEWPKLDELRLVANVVKHAEGYSAAELEKIRPEMFRAPSIRGAPPLMNWKLPRRVFLPMSGEDLYVTGADLDAYFEAVLGFWERLLAAVYPS